GVDNRENHNDFGRYGVIGAGIDINLSRAQVNAKRSPDDKVGAGADSELHVAAHAAAQKAGQELRRRSAGHPGGQASRVDANLKVASHADLMIKSNGGLQIFAKHHDAVQADYPSRGRRGIRIVRITAAAATAAGQMANRE